MKNNSERYKELQKKITESEKQNLPVETLLIEQFEIIKSVYEEFKIRTELADFSTNFDKYWIELEYLASMRKILIKLNKPTRMIEQEEERIKSYIIETFPDKKTLFS